MRFQAEKWLLLLLCAALSLGLGGMGLYAVIPLIAAVVEAALSEGLRGGRLRQALPCIAALGAFFYPPLFFYLPVFLYDLWLPEKWALLLCFAPGIPAGAEAGGLAMSLVLILMALAAAMKQGAMTLRARVEENHRLRDDAAELLRSLREKNSMLIEQQEEVAKMATLRERARIARDIHDSVGHVLSSALLQTGALMALSDSPAQAERLSLLNSTLGEGMDEVRVALHRLRDEAADLREEMEKLARGFTFCPVTLECDAGDDMPGEVKQAFAAIAREGLNNIARHSNAGRAWLKVQEHPAFYQLIVRDNGRGKAMPGQSGMGHENIRGRVEQLGGLARIGRTDRGFEIFVSVKKEEKA